MGNFKHHKKQQHIINEVQPSMTIINQDGIYIINNSTFEYIKKKSLIFLTFSTENKSG